MPGEQQRAVSEALARKDEAAVSDPTLRALLRLQGGREALVEGTRLLASTPAAPAAARLLALFDAAVSRGLGAHVSVDLGEVRGFAYYTGTIFHAFAAGTSDAILSGGRYDELLARFGCPMPSAGFALDLDRAAEARRAARVPERVAMRVVVVGPADDPRLATLRGRGVCAVAVTTEPDALAHARAWGYTHLLPAGTMPDDSMLKPVRA
jgi:ATP phosphoribosyltransferase regulatory subunit